MSSSPFQLRSLLKLRLAKARHRRQDRKLPLKLRRKKRMKVDHQMWPATKK